MQWWKIYNHVLHLLRTVIIIKFFTNIFIILNFKYLSEPAPSDIQELCNEIIEATIDMYDVITAQLLPTPAKSHYTFNLRDLSKVFQGMLMMDVSKVEVIMSHLILNYVKLLNLVSTDLRTSDSD